jgi:hypothetical protein
MAMETADRLSVRLDATTQFPVRVFACPDTEWALRPNEHEQSLTWMRSMIATVVALSSADDGQSDDAQMSLRLDSVALMLQNLDIHSAVLSEILVLIETGVRISYLGLPMNFPDQNTSIADDAARFEAWALLVRAVCGRPTPLATSYPH